MNILRNTFVQLFGLVSLNQLKTIHEMNNIKIKLSVPLFQQTAVSVFKAVEVYLHAFLYLVSD
jgi:predicted HTH domain antitoxin